MFATMHATERQQLEIPELKTWSEADLVRGIVAREAAAAQALYRQLLPVVHRALRRIGQHRVSEVEDLVQITFEDIVRSILRGRFEGNCALTTWASLIATRVGIDALRSRIRERRVVARDVTGGPEVTAVPEAASFERRLEARAEVAKLQEALAELPTNYSEALILHDVLGHPIQEMAEVLGIGNRAAQSRLFRGRRELRRKLEAEKARGG